MTVQISLSTTQVVAGTPINGNLVITNPGPAVNLTKLEPSGCMPGFAVFLTNGTISNAPAFAADCTNGPFVIHEGTTKFPFMVLTTYAGCTSDSAETTPDLPLCPPPGLPPGTYRATIEWSSSVPLPPPQPVEVTLVGD